MVITAFATLALLGVHPVLLACGVLCAASILFGAFLSEPWVTITAGSLIAAASGAALASVLVDTKHLRRQVGLLVMLWSMFLFIDGGIALEGFELTAPGIIKAFGESLGGGLLGAASLAFLFVLIEFTVLLCRPHRQAEMARMLAAFRQIFVVAGLGGVLLLGN